MENPKDLELPVIQHESKLKNVDIVKTWTSTGEPTMDIISTMETTPADKAVEMSPLETTSETGQSTQSAAVSSREEFSAM